MANKIPTFIFLFICTALASTYNYQDNNYHQISYNPNVDSKLVSIKHGVGAKLYFPSDTKYSEKLPLIIYFHGGGFQIGSTYWPPYDDFLQEIVTISNVIILSVEYRLSNLYPLPIGYDDSWSALQWVTSKNTNKSNSDAFLNKKADFSRVFLAGDSAGGNIAHNMAMRIAYNEIKGLKIKGIALLCPYFWGSFPIGSEPWCLLRFPFLADWLLSTHGLISIDDVRINPLLDTNLSRLGCNKVLVIVGIFDFLYSRGVSYAEMLKYNGYNGTVELMELFGSHDFFLNLPVAFHRYTVISWLSLFFNK